MTIALRSTGNLRARWNVSVRAPGVTLQDRYPKHLGQTHGKRRSTGIVVPLTTQCAADFHGHALSQRDAERAACQMIVRTRQDELMTALAHTNSTTPIRGAAWIAHYFWPLAMLLLVIRVFLGAVCNLVPDEAFYWTWTRHLSTGYFDHPPMIAWIIWLSTRVLGNTELGVRMPAALLSIGSLAVLYLLAGRVLKDRRAVGYVVLMWVAGPLLPVIGTIHTPDASATFFSVCALACAAWAVERDDDPSNPLQSRATMRWPLIRPVLRSGPAF